MTEVLAVLVEQEDRAKDTRRLLLDESHQRVQHLRERSAGCDHFQNVCLAEQQRR